MNLYETQKQLALLESAIMLPGIPSADRAELAGRHAALKGIYETLTADTVKAKADFYRAAIRRKDVSKAYEGLGGLPDGAAELGYGNNLLPKNLSKALLVEPVEDNPLREIELVSQIHGLEEPVLGYEIDDLSLADVTDTETAREIKLNGDTIDYGRFKTKVVCTIKDTIMYGTDLDVVSSVENILYSALAVKEKVRAFATESDETHDHMSFYLNGIKEMEGEDLIDAVLAAWADLPETFAKNAVCVMRRQDYYAAIRKLANSSEALWGKKPADVLGLPVKFVDRAVVPIVGDFRFARQNYDIGAIYDTDKDGEKGEYYFVLTVWGDHRIRLKNAFRLAKVKQ